MYLEHYMQSIIIGGLLKFMVSALPFILLSLSRFYGFAMLNFVVTAFTFCGFKMVEPKNGSTIFFSS